VLKKYWEEFKTMFAQYMQNEGKSRSKHHEDYCHRRKNYNPHYSIDAEVYIPYSDGNKNVKEYLEWESKLDQTFKKYKVNEYTRFSWATLCFQEYARSCLMLELVQNQK